MNGLMRTSKTIFIDVPPDPKPELLVPKRPPLGALELVPKPAFED